MQQLLQQGSGSASSVSAQSSGGYSVMQTVSVVAELTRAVMAKMGVSENGRVTFGQIEAYRRQLEEEYADKLKKDFELLGIDPNVNFQLKANEKGGLTVGGSHPDRDKVQKYFDDNPDMTEKYSEIQILADLEAARKKADISPAELKKRLQVENMAVWWNTEGGASSIMSYSGGVDWFSGVNTTV
jgi:hypothetical protein